MRRPALGRPVGRHPVAIAVVVALPCTAALARAPRYAFVDRVVPPELRLANIVRKVAMDQLLFGPVCITIFYCGVTALEGRSARDIAAEWRRKFLPTYRMEWTVWPLAQAINFYLMPAALRVAYVNVVTLLWNVYLSRMKHRGRWRDAAARPTRSAS